MDQPPEAISEHDGLEQTLQGLSAVIATVFEDTHLLAVKGASDVNGAAALRQAGEDVAVLASAMEVIRRRQPP